MRHFITPIWVLSLVAVTLNLSSTAHAFTLMAGSDVKGWGSDPLTFDVNYSKCPIDRALLDSMIDNALRVWNNSPTGGIRLVRGAPVDTTLSDVIRRAETGQASPPLILCETKMSAAINADADSIPAATSAIVSTDGSTSEISHAFILINAEPGKRARIQNIADDTEKFSLILAHEIGHALGLGHSSSTHSLMYFDVTDKEKLSLAQDDVDGITYLYPRKEPRDGAFACSTIDISSGDGPKPPGPGPFLALLGFCALGTWIFKRRENYLRFYA